MVFLGVIGGIRLAKHLTLSASMAQVLISGASSADPSVRATRSCGQSLSQYFTQYIYKILKLLYLGDPRQFGDLC